MCTLDLEAFVDEIKTDRCCAAAKTSLAQLDITVAGSPGLILRVSRTGTKVWACRYRNETGLYRRKKLGLYPDVGLKEARAQAGALRRAVAVDRADPVAEEQQAERDATTLDAVFNAWMEQHAKKKLDTWQDDQKRYEMHLK